MKYTLFIAAVISMLLYACDNNNQKATKINEPQKVELSAAAKTAYAPVDNWIDDFKNFRTAVLNKDESKLETYFTFPLQTDSCDVWMAVLGEDNLKQEQTMHKPFTQKDFKTYYQKIFSADFLQALLKIKSAKLYEKENTETQLFKGGEGDFRMYATFDKQENVLTLNLAYAGGKDENGSYISESEHNINYLFSVSAHHLHFKSLFIAG